MMEVQVFYYIEKDDDVLFDTYKIKRGDLSSILSEVSKYNEELNLVAVIAKKILFEPTINIELNTYFRNKYWESIKSKIEYSELKKTTILAYSKRNIPLLEICIDEINRLKDLHYNKFKEKHNIRWIQES